MAQLLWVYSSRITNKKDEEMFKLYTTNTCNYCNQIKKFFGAKSINYETVDVTDDLDARRELATKYNALTVPVLVKDNGDYMVGLDMKKLMSMIN